jgi:uncharacterized protein YciI
VELERYTFVLLRRPPDPTEYPAERLNEIQEQHLAHLGELRARGVLLLAGRSVISRTNRCAGCAC